MLVTGSKATGITGLTAIPLRVATAFCQVGAQSTPLLWMLTLLQLLLSEVAAHHRVAVLVNAIGEVLAGHADHAAFPVLQVALVDKTPLLHQPPS